MDDFLILLQAKLDEAKSKGNVNADIDKLQNQLNKLKVQVEIDPKTAQKLADDIGKLINQKIVIPNIGIDTGQTVKNAQKIGRQIGQQIQSEMNSAIQKGSFKKTFKDFGNGINNIAKDAEVYFKTLSNTVSVQERLGTNNNLTSFTVSLKNAEGVAEQLNYQLKKITDDNGNILDRYFEYTGGSINDNGVIKQMNTISSKADSLQTKLEKLKSNYSDVNASRPIKDSNNISALEQQYNKVSKTIENVRNADSSTFSSMASNAQKEITVLENMISQFRNAENVATQMKSVDITSGIAQAQERLGKLKANSSGFEQMKQVIHELDTAIKNVGDKSSLDKFINDLRVAESQLGRVKAEAKQLSEVNKIQLSMDTGETESKINALIAKTNQWTDINGNARISTQSLTDALGALGLASNEYIKTPTEENQKKLIESNEKLSIEYKKVTSDVRSMNAELAKDSSVESLRQQYQNFYSDNGKAHKQFGEQLKSAMAELSRGAEIPKQRVVELRKELADTKVVCKELGLTGQTWLQDIGDKVKQLSTYLSGAMIISNAVSTVRNEISELKELDSILTEIAKTADLTDQQLSELGNSSFESASEYGKTASDYLTGVQEMYRAGFENAESLAKLSLLAQSAGDLSPDSANDYLMATNAAYDYKGSVEELNKVLDSQNYITNNAAVSMQDMADATSEAASISAQYGVGIEELSSLIAVTVSKTRESGSEVGNALKSIFVTLQDTTSKPVVEAFDAVGISMTKIVDGSERLKTPIELLKELSVAFNELPEGDAKRANILTDIGKKYHANTLSAILSDWKSYESMLDLYSQGMGSAAKEAEKSANNIEGIFNRLKNTWIDTVENVINSDTILVVTKALNGMLSAVNTITDKLGSLGTIGLGAGLFAGVKNTGKRRISVRIS